MEEEVTVTISKVVAQWVSFAIIIIVFWRWVHNEIKNDRGMFAGLGAIIPIFFGLLSIIAWLILFFVIL